MRLHERGIHTNEKPYICDKLNCGKQYNTYLHKKQFEFYKSLILVLFLSLYRLKAHSRLHDGNLFECDKCSKKFTSKSDRKKHERIHSETKPFK